MRLPGIESAKSVKPVLIAVFMLLTASLATAQGVNINDTRLLAQPAISKDHIAFIYAGDLWTADLDGKNVRRLTADEGLEASPTFSPDGSLIAFTGQYDGNIDVYVVPVSGGLPKRLTWHPGADVVQSFTPDGSAVMFTSSRAVFTLRYTQLFTVPVNGGIEEPLKLPNAAEAAYSPDGSRLAYNPIGPAFLEWKHYRGGMNSTLWLYTISDNGAEKLPQPEGRSNDVDPMWMGDFVYFRSDRNGEFNLFSYNVKTKAIKQLTEYKDFPVLNASAGGGQIIYEQAGYLYTLDPKSGHTSKLTIGVSTDLVETRPRFVRGSRYIRNAALSPTGARAAFEFRGEIVTVPAEKGDTRDLTNSVAAHDRSPAWSPDGKSIAYFSDESGEYEMHIRNQDGKGDVRKIKLSGAGFYDDPVWSPDSQKISYTDNSWSLYWMDVKTGVSKKIGSEYLYGPSRDRTIYHSWSPDSKWLAYTLSTKANIQTVYAYSTEQDKSFAVTDGLSEVTEPVFDESGKYLYFLGSTNAGPVKEWFALSNADMRYTSSFYLAVLRNNLPNPLFKESDEEKGTPAKEEKPKDTPKPTPEPFSIDVDGLNNRILAIPLPAGNYSHLAAGGPNQFYYVQSPDDDNPVPGGPERAVLHQYDLEKRKDDSFINGVSDYFVSNDKKKIMYRSNANWSIVAVTPKPQPGSGRVNVDDIEVRIDPRAEWNQIFDEAWRINRDYFYAPNMHGANWAAMKEKYAAFLPHLTTRGDLNRVIQWMCSELAVGHHRGGGGDTLYQVRAIPGGLLGADYSVENGRYRFKKVYGGLNWNPELRSPLTEPGVNVKAGDYLLAVRGQDLRPPANVYSLFENTSGKIIEITVGPNPDGTGSRTVQVVPIANEGALRNRDWVEGNLKKVEAATGGRVAYVYVPNTGGAGHEYFKRYFFPQAYKDAIIVDERFNGGGSYADYYIDLLRRPLGAYWAMRYGADLKTPAASIQGPKVMITDETAGSGGDLLPWMWRKFGMGKLVGKRTWGGLVGILGFPVLMDGGTITAPNFAIWTPDEGWIVENEGVAPDIEVEQTPADVINGHDPQLEKAIQVVMEELKKYPATQPKRPPYPVKSK
ncbi:MAG TPA: PDZ domain-containing protein [Pyrinomonadaceae bacterium]|nr:PDZ domain-containing protein [Pyrinomonadaceae bacterium]